VSAIVLSVEYQMGGGAAESTLTRLTTAFERAGAELADVGKHVLPKLLPVLEVETAKQFDAEGAGPQAGSWAPLSVSYSAWKEAHYPGQPKLVATGALRAALTDSSASGALRDVSGDSLTFGTTGVPYASLHQTGTGRMPSRPPFDFGPDFEAGMQSAAAAGVREAVRAGSDGLLDFEGDEFEGQQVMTGRSGGRYVVNNGARTYLKRNKSGAVVKRTFGGRR
jgi:phage gpG-like protein